MDVDDDERATAHTPSTERASSVQTQTQLDQKPVDCDETMSEDEVSQDIESSKDDEDGPNDAQDRQSPLRNFTWSDLDMDYQKMVAARDKAEDELMDEFHGLVEFFQIWAATSKTTEVDQSTKSLATRIRHVQRSEQDFEEIRQHHERVVNAFQSALELLKARR